jgi:UDP-N-acetylglucosamine 4,6-dehydratase
MRVLITGCTGFFGRAFAKRLLSYETYTVCAFSRNEFNQYLFRRELKDHPNMRWFIGDVRDRDRLRRAMEGVDVVVHAAALKRIEVGHYNPEEMVKTNVHGTINVIEAATDAGVRKVVFLSSDKAYQPVSAYGQSKALAESMVLAANNARGTNGPLFAVTRYGNVSGSTGSVIPIWRKMIADGATVVPVTDPECTRFYMTEKQAVDLVLDTINAMQGGELVIPETLPAYRLGDLAEAMGVEMNITGLGIWEKLHEGMRDGLTSDVARRMTVDEIREALKDV